MSVADEQLNVGEANSHAFVASARRQATRDRLLEAAAESFRELGLQGASVEAICSRAGFTRGAFYSNFESKEQLFLTLLTREFERRTNNLREQAAALEPELRARAAALEPAEVARFIVEFFMPENAATTWTVLETEFLLLAMRDHAIASGYQVFMQHFYAEITEAITHIIGVANRRFVLPAEHATFVLSGVYEREIRAAALSGNPTISSYEGLGHQLAELLFAITEPLPGEG
jgi:AcrR family transcriptional regulator